MTYARAHLVNPDTSGLYHCTSRCVRRAWLFGVDPVSGKSYEHRKNWVESRILKLAEIFTVEICSYAVMSNHYHVVVRTQPGETQRLSDEAVAQRWLQVCSKKRQANAEQELAKMLGDPETLLELRKRLGSLSWFMKSLNEPIARAANREDGCKGRFWEARFRSHALLDEPALWSGMAYVDLNPVRAGVVTRPQDAPYTSLRRRIRRGEDAVAPLVSLASVGLTLPKSC